MKKIINDPADVGLTPSQVQQLKWGDPKREMSYEQVAAVGDGDYMLGAARVTARFLGLPEPYVIDDGVDDTAADVAFHKRLLLKSIGEGDTGFRAKESDSLMMTALRYSQLHPDEWRQYVRRWNLDERKLRRVYGVE